MDLKKVLKNVDVRKGARFSSTDVCSITDDSRKAVPGCLFIASKGHNLDGNKFIDSAIKAGAKVVVAENDFNDKGAVVKILVNDAHSALSRIADNFYDHPSKKLKAVGITGTNGKTTITYLLEAIIKASGSDAGIIGTINYRLKGKVLPATNTTPGALMLQGMLSEMVKMKIGYAVMEVSSHSLDQGRVDNVLFDVAIFTNLTSDHLDYHKTTENYFKAKKKIFDHLKASGAAVLNMDDKKIASMQKSIRGHVITYGIGRRADVMAKEIDLSMRGSRFTAVTPIGEMKICTKLIGAHNISNILAALCAAIALKLPKSAIVKGIEALNRVPGRLEDVEAGEKFKVLVDFAHTEDALLNVLRLLREVAGNRILTVFGCGGDRDKTKRPKMGRVACEYSDCVIITSDNPRHEDPVSIIREIENGVKGKFVNYDIIPERRDAIFKALRMALPGDIVLLAGKGHENYQIVKDSTIPFDDRKEALAILKRIRSR